MVKKKISCQRQHKEEWIYFGSQFLKDTVHCGVENVAAGRKGMVAGAGLRLLGVMNVWYLSDPILHLCSL